MGSFPERYNDSKCQHCLFTLRNSLNDAQTTRNTCACDVPVTFLFLLQLHRGLSLLSCQAL